MLYRQHIFLTVLTVEDSTTWFEYLNFPLMIGGSKIQKEAALRLVKSRVKKNVRSEGSNDTGDCTSGKKYTGKGSWNSRRRKPSKKVTKRREKRLYFHFLQTLTNREKSARCDLQNCRCHNQWTEKGDGRQTSKRAPAQVSTTHSPP